MTAVNTSAMFTPQGGDGTGIMVAEINDAGAAGRTILLKGTKQEVKAFLAIVANDISDATTFGKALLTAANVAAQITALGLGSVSVHNAGNGAGEIPILDGTGKFPAGTIPSINPANGSLTNAAFADMTGAGVKGATAAGAVVDLTPAQITAMLVAATSTTKGMMSAADKAKLDTYASVDRFKGTFTNLAALKTANPTGTGGEWAIILHGPGNPSTTAYWDTDETTPDWIDSNTSSGGSIGAGSVGTTELADDGVTLEKLAADSIDASKIIDGSVGTNELAALSVTLGKMASNSVDSSKIVDGSISTTDLGNNTVTNAKLADVATATIKGRVTPGSGDPEDLTATQASGIVLGSAAIIGSTGARNMVDAIQADPTALNDLKSSLPGGSSTPIDNPASGAETSITFAVADPSHTFLRINMQGFRCASACVWDMSLNGGTTWQTAVANANTSDNEASLDWYSGEIEFFFQKKNSTQRNMCFSNLSFTAALDTAAGPQNISREAAVDAGTFAFSELRVRLRSQGAGTIKFESASSTSR
jgi:hypothetical protein